MKFQREEIAAAATARGFSPPKNLGDVVYSFRYRAYLPMTIKDTAPAGQMSVIRSEGTSAYVFELVREQIITPALNFATIKIPDATPGVIVQYALGDEQALLARLRYNRLIDIFSGVTCYSLQNHLRTQVPNIGQIETDELCVGFDRRGVQYVLPVQAKGGKEKLSNIRIEQDIALCPYRFPALVCRLVAAQFMTEGVIALVELELSSDGLSITNERHYRLVPADEIDTDDLDRYRRQPL